MILFQRGMSGMYSIPNPVWLSCKDLFHYKTASELGGSYTSRKSQGHELIEGQVINDHFCNNEALSGIIIHMSLSLISTASDGYYEIVCPFDKCLLVSVLKPGGFNVMDYYIRPEFLRIRVVTPSNPPEVS